MRLSKFRELSKDKQKETVRKSIISLKKTQKFLEENGTFTFHNPKKEGGLVMEYIPYSPLTLN